MTTTRRTTHSSATTATNYRRCFLLLCISFSIIQVAGRKSGSSSGGGSSYGGGGSKASTSYGGGSKSTTYTKTFTKNKANLWNKNKNNVYGNNNYHIYDTNDDDFNYNDGYWIDINSTTSTTTPYWNDYNDTSAYYWNNGTQYYFVGDDFSYNQPRPSRRETLWQINPGSIIVAVLGFLMLIVISAAAVYFCFIKAALENEPNSHIKPEEATTTTSAIAAEAAVLPDLEWNNNDQTKTTGNIEAASKKEDDVPIAVPMASVVSVVEPS